MKAFYFCSSVLLFCTGIRTVDDNRFKLNAVLNEDIARALYRRVRVNGPASVEQPEDLDLDAKVEICRHITSSNLYKYEQGEEGVYMNTKIHQRLLAYRDSEGSDKCSVNSDDMNTELEFGLGADSGRLEKGEPSARVPDTEEVSIRSLRISERPKSAQDAEVQSGFTLDFNLNNADTNRNRDSGSQTKFTLDFDLNEAAPSENSEDSFNQVLMNEDAVASSKKSSDLRLCGMVDGLNIRDILRTNPTIRKNVYYDYDINTETRGEYLFTCLTIDPSHSENTLLYPMFISREYNMNNAPRPYIPGRFVFINPVLEGEEEMQLASVAEQPAKPLSNRGGDVERYYLLRNGEHRPPADKSSDFICRLTPDERVRACNLVLTSSEYFGDQLYFVPSHENIDETLCVKRKITFGSSDALVEGEKLLSEDEEEFEEWMITCRSTVQRDARFQYKFFLSRVHGSTSEVFVYREYEGKFSQILDHVFLENAFGNMRFKL